MDTMKRYLMVIGLTGCLGLGTAASVGAVVVSHVGSVAEGLTAPTSLLVAEDAIAVLEPFASQLVLFSAEGTVTNRIAIAGDARSLARLGGTQYLFCETGAGRVVKVDAARGTQSVFVAAIGAPVDVEVADGYCRVLDGAGRRVLVYDLAGHLTTSVQLVVPSDLPGAWLADLAWDPVRSRYYVWEQTHSRVLAFARTGEYLGSFCSFGGQDGSVTRGGEIVCDREGWVYVSDRYQGRVAVFDEAWRFVVNLSTDSTGDAGLRLPSGLAVDATGLVYVASTEGPGIDIFHLDKSDGPLHLPRAIPLSPAPDDTLAGAEPGLLAGVEAPAAMAAGLQAEFRIFALPDTTIPVASSAGVPVTDAVVAGNRVVGSATWIVPNDLTSGAEYGWTVRAVSAGGTGEWSQARPFTKGEVPRAFRLEQNVPNPFNPQTAISFTLAGRGPARLAIFNLRGEQVWQRNLDDLGPGTHKVIWRGHDSSGATVSSGLYFYRLVEGNRIETRKMVLMK